MKIALVSPLMSLRPMDSEFKRRMAPPMSLLAIRGLTPEPHEVRIFDENTGDQSFSGWPDIVGITVNVDTFRRAAEISGRYRNSGKLTVMGGIFPSSMPGEAARFCDAVCVGEAEELWPRIIDDAAAGRLSRIYRSVSAPSVDLAPLPDWNAIKRENYLVSNIVVSSRGCPHSCDFCYNSGAYVNRSYRNRPFEMVLAEIQRLGTRQVMFVDDNFIGNERKTSILLERMKPLGLTWHAAVSVDLAEKPRLMDLMAETGCRSLFIGFETINPDSAKAAGKHQNKVSSYGKLISALHERDIMINASLAFGFDQDTPEVFGDTLEWLIDNKIETMTSHILTPYPGTRLFDRLKSQGRITDFNTDHYNTSRAVFRPAQMTAEQLETGYLWMYENFYSFGSIAKRMPLLGSSRLIPYTLFNLAYRKFGKYISRLAVPGMPLRMSAFGKIFRMISFGVK